MYPMTGTTTTQVMSFSLVFHNQTNIFGNLGNKIRMSFKKQVMSLLILQKSYRCIMNYKASRRKIRKYCFLSERGLTNISWMPHKS